jgi:aryl-alcohol dehydrogenase-like predicted oxidoreductase
VPAFQEEQKFMRNSSPSRREITQAGALASVGLALSPFVPAAAKDTPQLTPITKPVPSTGERIPVIGTGGNQFGVETPEEMAELQEVLETMVKMGGSVVDTARGYGRSEVVLGDLLQRMGNRDRFFISTKTPIRGKLRSAEIEVQAAFDRLKVDTIDLMLIHALYGLDHLMPGIIAAKQKGRVRYIGISTSADVQYAELIEGMRRYPLDFIQVDYSIDNRSAADAILPLAAERGMAVLVNMPFGGVRDSGPIFGRVADRKLPDWAADIDATSWAQVFLKYVVSHPTVTAAIPGTIRVKHLIDNQGAGKGRLPDAALRREMERYWDAM